MRGGNQRTNAGSLADVAGRSDAGRKLPEIATRKIEGLRHFYGITDSKGLAYFTVHEEADKRHRAAWRQWLEQHGAQNTGVLETADEALRALWGALDSIYSAWSRGSALHSRLKPCLR